MLKAVIFDLDGVVADSHPIHEMAWKALLVEAGLRPEAINVDFLYAGHPRREILKHYLGSLSDSEIQHWGRSKDELYELSAKKLRSKPGIPRVLVQLEEAGVFRALATSAGRARAVVAWASRPNQIFFCRRHGRRRPQRKAGPRHFSAHSKETRRRTEILRRRGRFRCRDTSFSGSRDEVRRVRIS